MAITQEEMLTEAKERITLLGLDKSATEKLEQDMILVSCPDGTLKFPSITFLRAIEDFEKKYDAKVYHAVRLPTPYGLLDSLLYVSSYPEEWEDEHINIRDGYVMTYTINWNNPEFSEFGSICYERTKTGTLRRIG